MAKLWQPAAGRRLWRQQRGNAALEMAFIAPALVLLVVGLADYGTAVFRRMQVQHAAQAGADFAMRSGFNVGGITAAVTGATSFAGLTATPAPIESCGCASVRVVTAVACGTPCAGGGTAGTYVTVSATGSYTTILPYPGIPNSFNFVAMSMARTE